MSDKKLTVIHCKPEVNEDAVEAAKRLLEHIESGEIQSFCYAGITADGCMFGAGGTLDLLSLIGASFELTSSLSEAYNSDQD